MRRAFLHRTAACGRAWGIAVLLAMAPGAALAEVQFSGEARMGLAYSSSPTAEEQRRLRLFNDIRIRATVQTTTDTGLTIGATVRIDQANQPGIGR